RAAWAALQVWPLADTAEGYMLEAWTSPDFTGTRVSSQTAEISDSTLTALSPALSPQSTYYFRVGSLNHNGVPNFTSLGATATWTADISPSTAAVYLASVTVGWNAVNANGYVLEAWTNADYSGSAVSSRTTMGAVAALTALSPALANNTTYYFRAGALNRFGAVNFAALGPVSTLADPITNVQISMSGRSSATVSWTALPGSPLADTSEGYRLEACVEPDFSDIIYGAETGSAADTELTVTGLAADTEYFFRAGALNHDNLPNYVTNFTGGNSATTSGGTALSESGSAWTYVFNTDTTQNADLGDPFGVHLGTKPGAGRFLILASWEQRITDTGLVAISRLVSDDGAVSEDIRYAVEPVDGGDWISAMAASVMNLNANTEVRLEIDSDGATVGQMRNGKIMAIKIDDLVQGTDWQWSGIREEDDTTQNGVWEIINEGGAEEASASLTVSNGDQVLVLVSGAAENNVLGERVAWRTQLSGGGLGTVNYDERSWEGEDNPADGDYLPYFSARIFTAAADGTLTGAIQHQGVGSTSFDAVSSRVILLKTAKLFKDAGGSRADDVIDQGDGTAVQHDHVHNHLYKGNYLIIGQGAIGTTANANRKFMRLRADVNGADVLTGEHSSGVNDAAEADFFGFATFGLLGVSAVGNQTHRIEVGETEALGSWKAYDGSVYVLSEIGQDPQSPLVAAIHRTSATVNWTKVLAWHGYKLEASTAANFGGDLLFSQTASSATQTMTVTGLSANTTYYFRVGSLLNQADTVYSTTVSSPTLPPTVSGLDFKSVSRTSATVTWYPLPSAPLSATAEGYVVEASTAADFMTVIRSSATDNVALSTLTVSALKMQTTYYFRIGTLGHDGRVNYSASGSTLTPGFFAPQQPAYANIMPSSITVTWGVPPPPAVDSYRLYASTAPDFSGVEITSQTFDVVNVTTLTVYSPALDPNTTYYVRAGTILEDTTNYSNLAATSTLANQVSGHEFVQVLSSAVAVAWPPLPGAPQTASAEGYRLLASTAPDFSGTVLLAESGDVALSTLTISGLAADTTYYFLVGSLNWNNMAHFAPVISTLTSNFIPPEGSAAFQTYPDSVTVTWTAAPQSALDGYTLEASLNADFSPVAASANTADPNATSLAVGSPALNTNTTYYLRVGAVRGAAKAYAQPLSTATKAAAVSGTAVQAIFITSATVSWNLQATAAGYVLQACETNDFASNVRSSTTYSGSETQLTVQGLSASTNYYFRVGSLNHNANSYFAGSPIAGPSTTGTGAAPSEDGIVWRYVSKDAEQTKSGSSFSSYLGLTPGAGQWLVLAAWQASIDNTGRSYYSRFIVDAGSVNQDIRYGWEPPVADANTYRTHAVASVWTTDADDVLKIQIASEDATAARIAYGRIVAIPIGHLTQGTDWDWTGILGEDGTQTSAFNGIGGANKSLDVVAGDKILVLAAGAAETNLAGDRAEWRMSVGGPVAETYDVRSWEGETDDPADLMPYFSARVFTMPSAGTFSAELQHRGETGTSFDALSARVILVKANELFGDAGGDRADDVQDSAAGAAWVTQFSTAHYHNLQGNYLVIGQGAVGTTNNVARSQMQLVADYGNTDQIVGEWDNGVNDTGEADMETFSAFGLFNIPRGDMTHAVRVNNVGGAGWKAYDGSVYVLSEVGPAPKNVASSAVYETSVTVTWTAVHSHNGYVLEASTAADFSGALSNNSTADGDAGTLNISGLLPNTTYYFRAGSLLALSDTHYSPAVSTITLALPPNPLATTFLDIELSSVTAAWAARPVSPSSLSASGYVLEASSSDFTGDYVLVSSRTEDLTVSTLTVLSPALDANTRYYFRAASLNKGLARGNFSTLGSTFTLAKAPWAKDEAATFLSIYQSSITAAWGARPSAPQKESAVGYRLEASTAADFTGAVISTQTASVLESTLTVLSPALEPNTTYYFRAASLNFDGVAGPFTSLGATATFAQPPAPLAAGDTFIGVFHSSVTVAWAAFADWPPALSSNSANGYILEASTAADFAAEIVSSRTFAVSQSTLTISGLLGNSTHYFRVRSLNHNLSAGFALVLGSTSTLTEAPVALSAADTFLAVYETSATVAWAALLQTPMQYSGEGYQVEASSTGFDGTGVVIASQTYVLEESTLTLHTPALERNTTYDFRVAGLNHNRVAGEFTNLGSSSTLANPPVPLAPEDTFLGVFETSMTVAWAALPPAPQEDTAYGFRLEASSTNFDGTGVLVASQTMVVAESTLTVSLPALERNTTYYFRVGSWNLGNVIRYTALYATSTMTDPPSAPALADIFSSSATLSWSAPAAGAAGYRVLASSTGFNGAGDVLSSSTYNGGLTALTMESMLANTTYYFQVGAFNNNRMIQYAKDGSTITMANPPAAPGFSAVFTSSVSLTWSTPARGAQGFRFEASSTSFNGGGDVLFAETADGGATAITVSGLLADTTYFFRGGSRNQNGLYNYTGAGSTSTLTNLPAAPAVSAVFISSAALSWSAPAGGAQGFRLDASSTNFNGTGDVLSSSTANGALTGLTLPSLLANTTYFFRVGALNHNGVAQYASAPSSSTLADVATAPAFDGVFASSAALSWTAPARGTEGYRLEASSTNFNGAGGVLSSATANGGLTALSVPGLLTNTTYYFRIGTLNWNNRTTYAGASSTSTLAQAPSRLATDFTAVFDSSITARWAARPPGPIFETAEGYLLQASPNADFSGTVRSSSTLNLTLSTLTALSPALDPNTTYYFRVGAVNWNGVSNFTVLNATASLARVPVSPAYGLVTVSSATVNWGVPAGGAAGYRVIASTAADFTGTITSSQTRNGAATSLTVVGLLSFTTYYMRVGSLNLNDAVNFAALGATRTVSSVDTFPPAPVAGLSAATHTATSMLLTWSAPSDPSDNPLSGNYAILYATHTGVTLSTAGAQVVFSTAGVTPGSYQSRVVSGLSANTTYYFHLWTSDIKPNWSTVSNASTAAVLSNPAADAADAAIHQTSATVSWTPWPASPPAATAHGYRLEA
ncbi:MAG: fibronectin type III domain-containing protein, partial [Elusimicrobiota bacterium]